MVGVRDADTETLYICPAGVMAGTPWLRHRAGVGRAWPAQCSDGRETNSHHDARHRLSSRKARGDLLGDAIKSLVVHHYSPSSCGALSRRTQERGIAASGAEDLDEHRTTVVGVDDISHAQ